MWLPMRSTPDHQARNLSGSKLHGYKYLLVFIDTFVGWTKTFPTKETVETLTKKLLTPRHGFSKLIRSDNGLIFVSQVS